MAGPALSLLYGLLLRYFRSAIWCITCSNRQARSSQGFSSPAGTGQRDRTACLLGMYVYVVGDHGSLQDFKLTHILVPWPTIHRLLDPGTMTRINLRPKLLFPIRRCGSSRRHASTASRGSGFDLRLLAKRRFGEHQANLSLRLYLHLVLHIRQRWLRDGSGRQDRL